MNRSAKTLLRTLDQSLAANGADRPLGLAELCRWLRPGWQAELDRITHLASVDTPGPSCRRGCAACCYPPVPLAIPEALMLAELVEARPEAERTAIRQRFADAAAVLEAGGLGDLPLLSHGHEYLALSLPCPFLVDAACSIHSQRPAACREHLVVSPPELCATLNGGAVTIGFPLRLLDVLSALSAELLGEAPVQIPLVRALDWSAAYAGIGRRRWPPATVRQALLEVLRR